MRKFKRVLIMVLAIVLTFSVTAVNAGNDKSNNDKSSYSNGNGHKYGFKDVNEKHWAYEYINLMSDRGIINGYDDGTFKPSAKVTRGEFAKMMVLTLGLEIEKPNKGTFNDVKKSHWSYPYVETAKAFLTAYESGNGYAFKPDGYAVREDVAVAIVKGLGITPETTNVEGILTQYSDRNIISTNLKKYVATATTNGIMIGSDNGFNPLGNLNRAEAATLLARLIKDNKIVFGDNNKVTYDQMSQNQTTTSGAITLRNPILSGYVYGDEVKLNWTETAEAGFSFYKVVVSKNDPTPSYPDDGYGAYIDDIDDTDYKLKSGQWYNGGDFGDVIRGGETYYVAITAVYGGDHYTSNPITITIPGDYYEPDASGRTPVLTGQVVNNGVMLNWTETSSANFKYYKVVLSKNDSTPSYPTNGYVTYISNVDEVSYFLQESQKYKNGKNDVGEYVDDEQYYMAVTAVYSDGKYTSNSIVLTVPDRD